MNPAAIFVLMLGIGIPLTFIKSVILNVVVSSVCLAYLLFCKVKPKTLLTMLLVALPLAFGSYVSQRFYASHDQVHMDWTLGATLTLPNSVEKILFNLADHLHFSETFVYGMLSSFNMIHTIKVQWQRIKYSALVRGERYRLFQPALYLRIIVVALNLSGDLAQAMTSQGFSEGFSRSRYEKDELPVWQWLLVSILIVSYVACAIIFKPW